MEPEEAVQEEAAAPLPLISAALLLHVRQVQAEHGLKHTDYKRYRHAWAPHTSRVGADATQTGGSAPCSGPRAKLNAR